MGNILFSSPSRNRNYFFSVFLTFSLFLDETVKISTAAQFKIYFRSKKGKESRTAPTLLGGLEV